MAQVLEHQLLDINSPLVPITEASTHVIIVKEVLDKRAQLRDQTGRATEYLLRLKVTIQLQWLKADGNLTDPLIHPFSSSQVMTYDSSQLLAAHQQQQEWVAQMRQEIARQIIAFIAEQNQSREVALGD